MKKVFLGFFLLFSGVAQAAIVSVSIEPSKFAVVSFDAHNVVLWFTPSNCRNGLMTLPASSTVTDHSRLYSTAITAKLAKAKFIVEYDDSNPDCPIQSYGIYN